MSLGNHWLHESGGLVWHWRALRHRQRLWMPFCHTVAHWLQQWHAPRNKLLLIGPSAGYTLDADWLRQWHDVTACEPDPLARHLLPWRMGRRIEYQALDVFAPGGLSALSRLSAQHAVLFSNVLGQCAPRGAQSAAWYAQLHEALQERHWASYHDVISTARPPDQTMPQTLHDQPAMDSVIEKFWHGGVLEMTDHESFGLGQHAGRTPQHRSLGTWSLRPGQHHLIEWLSYAPA